MYFASIATKVTSLLEIYFASIAIKVTSLLERFIHLFFIFINNMRTPIENLALPLIFLWKKLRNVFHYPNNLVWIRHCQLWELA